MAHVLKSFLLSVASIPFVAAPGSVLAQSSPPANPPESVCMLKDGAADAVKVILPKAAEETMAAKGFVSFDCDRGDFSQAERLSYRDSVCRIAAQETETVQKQFEQVLGERPAVLCGMAELILGAWANPEEQS